MFGASTAGANDSTVIAVAQEKAKSRLKDGPRRSKVFAPNFEPPSRFS